MRNYAIACTICNRIFLLALKNRCTIRIRIRYWDFGWSVSTLHDVLYIITNKDWWPYYNVSYPPDGMGGMREGSTWPNGALNAGWAFLVFNGGLYVGNSVRKCVGWVRIVLYLSGSATTIKDQSQANYIPADSMLLYDWFEHRWQWHVFFKRSTI